ncbi:MAG: BamA/TamA family outer membrane protein [Salinivirgaceae bacterium]
MELKLHKPVLLFLGAVLFFMGQSCKPTRLLSDDEYLLQKNKIKIDKNAIDKKELQSYYRQIPNKRTLVIFKLPLSVYNFSHLGKERKWKTWLARVIGEEPIIYDSLLVQRTALQFERYLKNEAYYNADVTYHTNLKRKKAKVAYLIKLNQPIVINEVAFNVLDSFIEPLVLADTLNSLLKPGELFALSRLEDERMRIANNLRDSGYFDFTVDYIKYEVDTFDFKADINVVVKANFKIGPDKSLQELPHKKYWINKVYFLPDYDPQEAIRSRGSYYNRFDTIQYKDFGFIYPEIQNVRPKVLLKANALEQGGQYSMSQVNNTLFYLNSLRLFRLTNISFKKLSASDSLLNCNIQLTPATYQGFSVNLETTNTEGNFGLGGNFNYQHKNLFRGAEIFNLRFSGAFQRQTESETYDASNIIEYGVEASLETPSFILPFRMKRFYKSKRPKTIFLASYNYQHRPDYTRVINNINMGYRWRGKEYIRHIVSPLDLSLVDVRNPNESFLESIKGTFLENNYQDYFIAGGSYSLIFQNKPETKGKNYAYFRWNLGGAGNLMNLFHKEFGTRDTVVGGYYEVFDLKYAQYTLTDVDFRYYHHFNILNQLVTRFFAGVAVPYGNAEAIPFVKQYYSGGSEGIRAWRAKDLGPGTYAVPDSLAGIYKYPNQMGDVKFEFNLEYRFGYNKSWRGAVFLDVGNIWSLKEDASRPGSAFDFKKFYRQLAVGSGFGFRYDMDFAVFRLDWGLPIRDPKIAGRDAWIFNKKLQIKDFVWNFAIGYPF